MSNFIGILLGGPGHERLVSLRSAEFVFRHFPLEKGRPFFIAINENLLFNIFWDYDEFIQQGTDNLAYFKPDLTFYPLESFAEIIAKNNIKRENIVGIFPLVHGTAGEDGLLLAFFQALGIRCAGFDYRSSLLAFDKVLTKLVLQSTGLNIVPFQVFQIHEPFDYQFSEDVFVKPAREGSSCGVSKATNPEQLQQAVQEAFRYDTKIIIEKCIYGRELECAVLQTEKGWLTSAVGEVVTVNGFYSFDEKYKTTSQTITKRSDLSSELIYQIQDMALRAILAVEGQGFARVDFFLDNNNFLYLNEINSLPGFTAISMFPFLFLESGFTAQELITEIIARLWH